MVTWVIWEEGGDGGEEEKSAMQPRRMLFIGLGDLQITSYHTFSPFMNRQLQNYIMISERVNYTRQLA